MKHILNGLSCILRKLIVSFLIINTFNFICGNLFIFIPINILTILIVTISGIPGIILINLLYYLI